MKAVASVFTGSIAIRADAVHSTIDLLGVIVGYIGIRIADKPADEEHTFGHGKAEHIASGIIAGLIFIAAGIIFYQALHKLITGVTVELVAVGIYVTLTAIVVNSSVSWYALRVAHSSDSVALEATARDLFADVLSSVAVLVGLILVELTGLSIFDPIIAMLVAIIIARTAYSTIKKSFGGLMDTKLPVEEEEVIIACIEEHSGQLVGFHEVRTRRAGGQRFIDLHLMLPKNASVEEAHNMCDHLEQDIESKLPNSSVTIHVEPCEDECRYCLVSPCSLRINVVFGE